MGDRRKMMCLSLTGNSPPRNRRLEESEFDQLEEAASRLRTHTSGLSSSSPLRPALDEAKYSGSIGSISTWKGVSLICRSPRMRIRERCHCQPRRRRCWLGSDSVKTPLAPSLSLLTLSDWRRTDSEDVPL